jgi:hypothetical protein
MALTSLALIVLCLQTPVHGWGIAQVPPGEVKRIYWELLQTTEVLVRLVPADPDGKPVRVDLVFQAFFPGRPERIGAAMQWPKGRPARLTVAAQAFPATFVIPELSLRLVMDGATVDLTGAAGRYRHLLPCPDCTPNGVEADLEPAMLQSLITARSVEGQALGFPIRLTPADQTVLADFAARIGLSVDQIRLISAREVSAAERTHSLVGLADCSSRNRRDTPRDPAPAPCADRR